MEKKPIELEATIELLERKLQHQNVQLDRLKREAQVEAALEVVRSRTMAMFKSDELGELVEVLFQQLKVLGINAISGWVSLVDVDKQTLEFWIKHGDSPVTPVLVDSSQRVNFKHEIDAWVRKEEYMDMSVPKKETFIVLKSLFNIDLAEVENESTFHLLHIRHEHGYLGFGSWQEVDEDSRLILKRFTRVFDQTYTRFLDLHKAEALANEARIEATLERIRSRAMSMHNSHELPAVIAMVLNQLCLLGFEPIRCFIIIINDITHEMTWWTSETKEHKLPKSYLLPPDVLDHTPLGQAFFRDWVRGTSFRSTELLGEAKQDWDQLLFTETQLMHAPDEIKEALTSSDKVVISNAFTPHGALEYVGFEALSDRDADILQRFSKVMDLTYTRYVDLQHVEARAREANRQASLDRVRGEIASMRSAEDLQRITPLIWHELTTLGVPFFRCGVFIIDEINEAVHSYLSTPEGHPLGVMDIPFGTNAINDKLVEYWRVNKVFKDHWNKEQFIDWMQSLIEQRRLRSSQQYQGNTSPPESLFLNFIPFTQGMLYVGNRFDLNQHEIELVQALAQAFSIAYARYEDFKQMEEAKQRVEMTLTELKAAQSQLIQSEKMASLGEVTAGIAHEIQNPLNFVNNISEINRELIEEMLEEIKAGNLEEAILIAQDLEKNESKVVHYGKRADAIVKGMLEHSQRTSGAKALTNMNALIEEYIRLSYHGQQAKDKTFEAEYTTILDENLPKINVIPQDIGRVLLNIINNAFYAVNEKRQKHPNGYTPSVCVQTRQVGDSAVEIRIQDNGIGIPDTIKDKIFQPFFTTKPSGQGTGLGLSLTYDIVNAHGGTLDLECTDVAGTVFLVKLPV